MDLQQSFTEDQIKLLEEALNIGAGNTVTALSQLLQCDADMSFPKLDGFLSPLTSDTISKVFGNNTRVEMSIVGELQGGMAVVIPEADEHSLVNLIRVAKEEQRGDDIPDISIITEVANIIAGVFLTAIHDFCGLNIFHTVPVAGKGIADSQIGILQQPSGNSSDVVLLITNEFYINRFNIKAYLLITLSTGNSIKLIQAIENIKIA